MAVNVNKGDAAKFMHAAFDLMPSSMWLLMWTLPDRKSRWFKDVNAAITEVPSLADSDVYVGAALSSRNRGAKQRGNATDVAGIVGLWADIDIADDVAHSKANLPPDEQSALSVVKAAGPEPTALVHSGHGLQAWWLFAEPWLFDNEQERSDASRLAMRWGATLKLRAAENGWVIDSTHDLSRVMRLPGTINHKGDAIVSRLLDLQTKRRYNPSDDFDQFLADDSALSLLTGRRTYHVDVGQLRLSANAQPDLDRFEALRANVKAFAQSWERQRRDLSDTSASSYDMALASFAAQAGWTDQQIVDLIIASRRKHGDDLKLRPDYYARTIAKVRDDSSRAVSLEALEQNTEHVELSDIVNGNDSTSMPAAHARHSLLDNISTAITVALVRIEKLLSDPVRWRFVTTTGEVMIGDTLQLLNQQVVRAAVSSVTGVLMPRFKPKEWDRLVQAMLRAAVDREVGDEATDRGLGYTWLVEYLQDRPLVVDLAEACESHSPHRCDDSAIFVFGPALRRWLWLSRGERVTPQRMGEVLRAFGCEHERLSYQPTSGPRTTASAWRLPDDFASMFAA